MTHQPNRSAERSRRHRARQRAGLVHLDVWLPLDTLLNLDLDPDLVGWQQRLVELLQRVTPPESTEW